MLSTKTNRRKLITLIAAVCFAAPSVASCLLFLTGGLESVKSVRSTIFESVSNAIGHTDVDLADEFLPRDAMHCAAYAVIQCLCVRLAVTFVDSVKTSNRIYNFLTIG